MRHRRGFTLIEILTSITIILILIGMLFVGLKYLAGTTRERDTRVRLKALDGMLVEFQQGAGLGRLEKGSMAGAITAPGAVGDNTDDRDGYAVIRTQRVMRYLLGLQSNLNALQTMPPTALYVPGYNNSVKYYPGDQVKVAGVVYQRIGAAGTGANVSDTSNWTINPSGTPVTPVLLDSENNPIIYIAAPVKDRTMPVVLAWGLRYGLLVVTEGSNTNVSVGNPRGLTYPGDPGDVTVGIATADTAFAQLSQFRPFFAAAGTDENFQTGDDNLYSFQD